MSENEFLLYLNSLTVTNNYDNDYFKKVFEVLYMFFEPVAITNDIFKRKEEPTTPLVHDENENDIVIDISNINSCIIIKNPKRKLHDKEFMVAFLKTVFNNIFKNRQIQEELRLEKDLDGLLKVYNRLAYEEKITTQKGFTNTGVAFIDVNGLGVENNMYGHEAGDRMLSVVASCLKSVFRFSDIYRIGGDEFVIVSEDITPQLFDAKLEEFNNLIKLTEYSVSIGSAYREQVNNIKEAIEEANVLMKYNKEAFRKEHPEKYLNKYEVAYVGKKDASYNFS